MNRHWIQKLVYCGILIALSIILSRFASIRFAFGGVENIRVGFGAFPILIAGVLFGPLYGAVVGIVADIGGFMISPIGAYMPHFTLVSAMYGFIPGLAMYLPFLKNLTLMEAFRIRFITGVVLSQLITQWTLLPWFLFLVFEIPFQVSLIPRYFTAPIQIVAYTLLGLVLFTQPVFQKWIKR